MLSPLPICGIRHEQRRWGGPANAEGTRGDVLQIEGLTKVYHSLLTPVGVKAVDNLTLSIRKGETYSIVGPNGSGKTTTLKIVLGLIYPTSGVTTIFGKHVSDLSVRAKLGFLPEDAYLYDVFSGRTCSTSTRDCSATARKRKAQRGRTAEPGGHAGEPKGSVPECSKGMRQRIALAQALVNDPELLILDEPTSGLDRRGGIR